MDTLKKAPERPLVIGHGMKDQAALSPDGRTLIFVSTRDGKADLYTLPFDPIRTMNVVLARRLTRGNGANLRPTFSPDGRRIVFTSTRDAVERGDKRFPFAIQTSGNLYAMELASREMIRLTHTDGWDGSAASRLLRFVGTGERGSHSQSSICRYRRRCRMARNG